MIYLQNCPSLGEFIFIHLSLVLFKQGIILDCTSSVSYSSCSFFFLWYALSELSKYFEKLFASHCSNKTCFCSHGTSNSLLLDNFVECYGIKCCSYKWLFFQELGWNLFALKVPLILMESHSYVFGISQSQTIMYEESSQSCSTEFHKHLVDIEVWLVVFWLTSS